MICFTLWFWLWCAFYNRSLKKHIILLSKCTSRLTNKRIHIKLVSSVCFCNRRPFTTNLMYALSYVTKLSRSIKKKKQKTKNKNKNKRQKTTGLKSPHYDNWFHILTWLRWQHILQVITHSFSGYCTYDFAMNITIIMSVNWVYVGTSK